MTSLRRGTLSKQLIVLSLAAFALASSRPVLGEEGKSNDLDSEEVAIRTLSPLASSSQPISQPVTSSVAQSNRQDTPSQVVTPTAGMPAVSTDSETTEPMPIAQAAVYPPPITDPYRRKLPTTTGRVEIRKPFKLFAREELIRSLSFRDTPVRDVLAELARRGSINLLIDKSVVGKITGELRDVTLNEAMDNTLAAAGLQSRVLSNNTIVVGTHNAMVQLGLNRTQAKVFKLSYAHPYDVAQFLYSTFFNKGISTELNNALRRKISATDKGDLEKSAFEQLDSELKTTGEGGVKKILKGQDKKLDKGTSFDEDLQVNENNHINRLDVIRTIRGTSRAQTQEGVGFNNAATDPGSQQVRQFQETIAEFVVEQNAGGAIVCPDVKNRQVIVVGTVDDIKVAEEAIALMDRRPKLVHIQASLVELTNQGIRQLGAAIQTAGGGGSAFVLGQNTAPLVATLPGQNANTVGPETPNTQATIAGVTSTLAAQSLVNFLSLNQNGGGRMNVSTFPGAFNVTLNTLLETHKAKLVANPTVVVVDDTEALITLAQEVVHKITTTSNLGVTTTNVELTKAGIFLNVLPKTTEDGFIRMRLRPHVSTPLGAPLTFGAGASFTVVTLLNIREIIAQEVRIKDGQTLVLGGLFTENEAANLAKIPYAAEMPILGAIFRNSLKGRARTELMILITPKIVEEEPPVTSSASGPATM